MSFSPSLGDAAGTERGLFPLSEHGEDQAYLPPLFMRDDGGSGENNPSFFSFPPVHLPLRTFLLTDGEECLQKRIGRSGFFFSRAWAFDAQFFSSSFLAHDVYTGFPPDIF